MPHIRELTFSSAVVQAMATWGQSECPFPLLHVCLTVSAQAPFRPQDYLGCRRHKDQDEGLITVEE